MQKRLECEIEGRVQLVMFRDYALRKAQKRELVGTVENTKSGSVYVVAEGEEAELKKFLEDLRRGPYFAKVTKVMEVWLPPTGKFTDFQIIFYGDRS